MGFRIKKVNDIEWKHSFRDFGIVIERKSIPETPLFDMKALKIAGRHGAIPQKRVFDSRVITLECSIKDILNINSKLKIQNFVSFCMEKLVIAFDDRPELIYFVELSNTITSSLEIRNGKFIIEFTSFDGFRYSLNEVKRQFLNINSSRIVDIVNDGNFEAKPIIKIEGSARIVNIRCNGVSTSYKDLKLNEKVVIDCCEYIVKKEFNGDITNALVNWGNDFISLPPGINTIEVSGEMLNLSKLEFVYRHTYL